MIIRDATSDDWPAIWAFFRDIVAAGETYAYPENLTSGAARDYWTTEPPGTTVVAVDGATVLGSASMGPNRPGRGSHGSTASS